MKRTSLKILAVVLATAAGLAACGSNALTAPGTASGDTPPEFSTSGSGRFAKCTKYAGSSTSATIGTAGGKLAVGGHTFTIPAGALSSPVTITMSVPSDTLASVQFQPAGLNFNLLHLPKLSMNVKSCSIPSGAQPTIVYVSDNLLTILESLLSTYSNSTVTAYLLHFSRYAVHY